MTLAATVVFCYSCLVPIALWAVFWWRGVQTTVTLLQLVCLYGYSLTVYIPISVRSPTDRPLQNRRDEWPNVRI